MPGLNPIFDLNITNPATLNNELWVDLGLIPTGSQIWFGYATYFSEDKKVIFELRSNLATKSAGTTADTKLHDAVAARDGETVDRDLYRNGRTIIQSVAGAGVEHWWLRLRSKNSSAGDVFYSIWYTNY